MHLLRYVLNLPAFALTAIARSSIDFKVNDPVRLAASHQPSPNKVTANTVRLHRAEADSVSAGYLEAVRSGNHVDGVYSRLQNGTASVLSVRAGSVFLAPLTAGNQSFYVVIDTGSSDTWLVNSDFTCVDPSTSTALSESDCAFGPLYSLSSTAQELSDVNFNISYADGERLNGGMVTEDITFSGINAINQTMGRVTTAGWYGDGVSSGLVGLAYPSLTNQYSGSDPDDDVSGLEIPYDPLFTTMYTTNLTSPIFSIALDRDGSASAQASGGLLAIGGIPDILHGSHWATANISVVNIDATTGIPEYQFYSIEADGWAVSSSQWADFDVSGTGNTRKTALLGAPTRNVIVDSGTSLIYAPTTVIAATAAAFAPAATIGSTSGLYEVDCNAVAPLFGVVVQKKVFYINGVDMIIDTGYGFCITGVQDSNDGLTILGDVFLRNVLAVFDIGAAQMRFAARETELTNATISH